MQRGMKPILIRGAEWLHSIAKTTSLRGLVASAGEKGETGGAGVSGSRRRNRKSDEQVSPSLLLRGMTTLTQRQPRICLSSVKLFNPQSATQRETTDTKARAQGSVRRHNCYVPSRALYFEATNHVLLCGGMYHLKELP